MPTDSFQRLVKIMRHLRSTEGCPWDREQTIQTLRRYLLEETYEVLDAMEREDWPHLVEELGDLQLQIVFQAQIASEDGNFDIEDVLRAISEKLVRRHPHVFSNKSVNSPEDVLRLWEQIKVQETEAKRKATEAAEDDIPVGLLDGIQKGQPALREALQIGKIAAKNGFDWKGFDDLSRKLKEELQELEEAKKLPKNRRDLCLEEELGDLLFMVVNIARHVKVDPEVALRSANRKFRERFTYIEHRLLERGKLFDETDIEELEELWIEAKKTLSN